MSHHDTAWQETLQNVRYERFCNGKLCVVQAYVAGWAAAVGPVGAKELQRIGWYDTATGAKRAATQRAQAGVPVTKRYEVRSDEGHFTGSLEDFFPDGDAPPRVKALLPGESYYGGGGADASYKIKRVK